MGEASARIETPVTMAASSRSLLVMWPDLLVADTRLEATVGGRASKRRSEAWRA